MAYNTMPAVFLAPILARDALSVTVYGSDAQNQVVCDLLVCFFGTDQTKHFLFPFTQFRLTEAGTYIPLLTASHNTLVDMWSLKKIACVSH